MDLGIWTTCSPEDWTWTFLTCPGCGKLEFFRGEWSELEEPEGSGIAMTACPACGKRYELDSPKCPFCGEKNTKLF